MELSWIRLSRSPGCDGSTAQIPSASPYTIQPPTSEKMPEGVGVGAGSSAGLPALRRTHGTLETDAIRRTPIAIMAITIAMAAVVTARRMRLRRTARRSGRRTSSGVSRSFDIRPLMNPKVDRGTCTPPAHACRALARVVGCKRAARSHPHGGRMGSVRTGERGVPQTGGRRYRRPVRFGVLGPLEVSGEDGPLPLGGPKQRMVLAHLVLGANRVVPADRLIDALWGEEPPEAARGTLQAYVSRLRSALGSDAIEGRAPGYLLRADPEEVDALRFEGLLRKARGTVTEPRSAAVTLAEALELWRGPALADLADEPSLSGDITRLEELRLQAVEEKTAVELDLGHHAQVVAELETLTRINPLRERLWGELMLALYRLNRQAEALLAFERARAVLSDELGIDPSPELRRLHERILRQDPDLELKGEPLRGYRLLEQVGEGAFGIVYRATQPQIGREVAIKAVPPELANHPDFVRRFEREAQIVARLEHPHIVPLYDYWREPDAAYLVMRFLRGGSLEDLLRDGPLEPARAAAILDQIAGALAAAHRQGIVHRDVKPGNVLLDEEGNAYLTDFGVALDAGSPERSSGTMMRGTPAYLSPEQIRLDPASPQSDVYALGVVAYEMLAGAHPFPESSLAALLDHHMADALPSIRDVRPELPPAVDRVIARATAKDTEARFPDALELAAAFRAALEGALEVREPIGEIRNPYKGLRAFREADAGDFFGREAVTQRLLRRLEEDEPGSRFLAVVGPSGSGKSSVVRAGLVPALRRGALPGSERWYVVDLLPGAHPLRELESALLGVAVEPPPSLMDELESQRARSGPRRRPRAARPARRARDRRRSARGGLHPRRERGTSARICSRSSERRRSSRGAGSASSPRCARTSSTSRCRSAASATCSRRARRRSPRCPRRTSSERSSSPPSAKASSWSRGSWRR